MAGNWVAWTADCLGSRMVVSSELQSAGKLVEWRAVSKADCWVEHLVAATAAQMAFHLVGRMVDTMVVSMAGWRVASKARTMADAWVWQKVVY